MIRDTTNFQVRPFNPLNQKWRELTAIALACSQSIIRNSIKLEKISKISNFLTNVGNVQNLRWRRLVFDMV